jgi:hypothetical protein
MAALHIVRSHDLGLARSRHVVRRWVEETERSLDLRCSVQSGPHGDIVEFTRPGVQGRLEATADRFELNAELGWTFVLLHGRIQREIEAQVDALLAAEAEQMAARSGSKGGKTGSGHTPKPASQKSAKGGAKPAGKKPGR